MKKLREFLQEHGGVIFFATWLIVGAIGYCQIRLSSDAKDVWPRKIPVSKEFAVKLYILGYYQGASAQIECEKAEDLFLKFKEDSAVLGKLLIEYE